MGREERSAAGVVLLGGETRLQGNNVSMRAGLPTYLSDICQARQVRIEAPGGRGAGRKELYFLNFESTLKSQQYPK